MPALTYNYVYFPGGKHTRQPRVIGAYGGFSLIQSIPGGTLATGDTVGIGAQPATQTVAGATYSFAFVNVSGGTGGGQTSFVNIVPPPQVTVGAAPIVVLVVYVPTGGGGGSDTGASIDAFDESTGTLVDDTFVTVSPDTGGAQTSSGNIDGWVDTVSGAETIAAFTHITPTGANFDKWINLATSALPPAGVNFAAAKGADYDALAFYKAPPVIPPPVPDPCQETLQSLNQLFLAPAPGLKLTLQQQAAIKAQLATCLAQKKITQAQYNQALVELDDVVHKGSNPIPPPKVK